MHILIVGGGGREHAIAHQLRKSKRVTRLSCAPGNGGIAEIAACVPIPATDIEGMCAFAREKSVDMAVVAPDDPLAMGMVDALEKAGIRAFGPNAAAAKIEASKSFAKDLMRKYGIPTADYAVFDELEAARAHLRQCAYPTVVKADGLALGKGVLICEDYAQADAALCAMLRDKSFGEAGSRVVIEEFITGPEVSILAFTDGKTLVPMVSAQDHKRALDNDEGLNTGGMGTFAPSPKYTPDVAAYVMERIMLPTMDAMNAEGRTFKGVLYFGLMLTSSGPKVLEYNARFGDPETQVILPLLQTDLVDIFDAIIDERLSEIDVRFSKGAAVCVILASGGYPGDYPKGLPISGLDSLSALDCTACHAGTKRDNGVLVTSGGRVLGITATADSLSAAIEKAYRGVRAVSFDGMHYRTDIGKKVKIAIE